jgi:ABC-type phosphate/phosphonate transport system ATPase subunit
LILGSSDSGKSTLLKQLRILHGGGFTESELLKYAIEIRKGILEILIKLLRISNERHGKDIQDVFEF